MSDNFYELKEFLMFGDSITEYSANTRKFPDRGEQFALCPALINDYMRKMEVVTRGYSGYTSRWALKLLPNILKTKQRVSIAYVFFGTNDAAVGNRQEVPVEEYKSNSKQLVEMLQEKGIKVILVGPAMHDAEKFLAAGGDDPIYGTRTNERNKEYSEALRIVAQELDTGFVDLYSAFEKHTNGTWKDLLDDGIHYSGAGYEVFYNELTKEIANKYPEFAANNMPYLAPNWRDVAADGSNL